MFKKEFGIPTKKIYSGELCPDHCNVVVLDEAVEWAEKISADFLLLKLQAFASDVHLMLKTPLVVVVLEATSGMNLPVKLVLCFTLADICVVTKIDLVSQAEREVFRYRILNQQKK